MEFNEDRSRIRTDHGPQNVARLVFDYLRVTKHANRTSSLVPSYNKFFAG
jgi:predicted transposase YbfD/YdcC